VHHISVSCNGQQTPARVQVRHVRQLFGPDGREYFLIGLEFLSVPSALEAQIGAWTASVPQISTEGV
jgi:hypothetical protein